MRIYVFQTSLPIYTFMPLATVLYASREVKRHTSIIFTKIVGIASRIWQIATKPKPPSINRQAVGHSETC